MNNLIHQQIYCELQARQAGESQESEDRVSVCPAAPLSPPRHSPPAL